MQAPADLGQRHALLPDPGEDLLHHSGLLPHDLVARLAAALLDGDVTVTIRRPAQHVDAAPPRCVQFAPAAALADFGTLVLGHDPLDLQQQVVFRTVTQGAVEEHHLDAAARELVHEQDLVGVFPGQPIRGVDIEPIDGSVRYLIAELLQGRA